jgi:hypothetical protein
MTDHEDTQVDRELHTRQFAWMLVAALSDTGDPDPDSGSEPPSASLNTSIQGQSAAFVYREAARHAITAAELERAELEIRRTYLPEDAKRYLARAAQEQFIAAAQPEPCGPSSDAEDYYRDDGIPL